MIGNDPGDELERMVCAGRISKVLHPAARPGPGAQRPPAAIAD
jgi:hypothetical protein